MCVGLVETEILRFIRERNEWFTVSKGRLDGVRGLVNGCVMSPRGQAELVRRAHTTSLLTLCLLPAFPRHPKA